MFNFLSGSSKEAVKDTSGASKIFSQDDLQDLLRNFSIEPGNDTGAGAAEPILFQTKSKDGFIQTKDLLSKVRYLVNSGWSLLPCVVNGANV